MIEITEKDRNAARSIGERVFRNLVGSIKFELSELAEAFARHRLNTIRDLAASHEPINAREMTEVTTVRYIDILRSDIASSVTILSDNEEADTLETQRAIEVEAEWTDDQWRPVRFYGETILQALAKARQHEINKQRLDKERML